jgi:hypothetical protein
MISEIKLIFDMDNRTWVADATTLSPAFADITIGFRSKESPIVFRDLSFGLTLANISEDVTTTHSFPKPGCSYISTDQLYVELIRVEWTPNTLHTLSVWCIENGVEYKNNWKFSTPILIIEPYPDYEVE